MRIEAILGTIILGLLSVCGFLYFENSKLLGDISILQANEATLKNSIEKQNKEIEKMKVDDLKLKDEYKKIYIKYDALKISIEDIEGQSEELARQEQISKNEAKLMIEKRSIEKALAHFFQKGNNVLPSNN